MKLRPKNIIKVAPPKTKPSVPILKLKQQTKAKPVPPWLVTLPQKEQKPDIVEESDNLPFINKPVRWEKMYEEKANFYIAKLSPLCTIPKETMRWCRNAADERAAQEGYRFCEEIGQEVVYWIEDHCILYEGSKANTPLICDDWQYEYVMQLFGWQYNSPELGRWIRRFTHAGIWIAKKNAKSPTLAATGLYALCGDGEQGQKCYCVARDGKQARIAHNHAIEMVKNSPVLFSECKINHTDGVIRHIPTKSTYSVVHADNSRSTEGFNGSLFCDETHVLAQIHMDRLKRAGISRDEPLHVEVSTAGNNADDYGFNRYEYGLRVSTLGQLGEIDIEEELQKKSEDYNPHFLFMDFSIDQKVTVDKLRNEEFINSIAYRCNPSLGRILRFEEFKSDWRDSLLSETELRKFAMYRLNLWLKDSAAWIELADWLQCSNSPFSQKEERQYTLEDLQGYPCVGGLDLSKTKDMTAFSLIFAVPDDEIGIRPYTWTWHWLPQPTAQKYKRYINLFKEDFKPWIRLVPQKTVDYENVMRRMEWVRENFDLRGVGYDPWGAPEFIKILMNDYSWSEDFLVKIPQGMRYMGPITKEFERWIIRHEVHHPNNSLLSWQFQHVALDTDRNGNYKPMKPDKADDYRKIDGIISLLIAAATMMSDSSIWTPSLGSILLFDREGTSGSGKTETLVLKTDYEEFNELKK